MSLAKRAYVWLFESVYALKQDLETTVADEPRATLGAELCLLAWLASRFPGERTLGTLRPEFVLRSLGTWEVTRCVAITIDPHASSGWLLHELALESSPEKQHDAARAVEGLILQDRVGLPPVRGLELLYLLHAAGVPQSPDTWRSVLDECIRAQRSDVFAAMRDLYTLTHLVFYATDFGISDLRLLSSCDRKLLCRRLDDGMQLAVENEHIDLIAEICLASRCLKSIDTFSKCRKMVEGFLLSNNSPVGRIPESAQSFLTRYHPILVYCIMTTTSLAS